MISVIVATRDRASLLKGTLEALCGQVSPGCPVEILVVDNGSIDETRQVVETAAAQSRIPVVYLTESRAGKSHALNTAAAHARGGEFIRNAALARDPRFASNVDRVANLQPLETIVGEALGRLTREEAIARLTAAGIACGRFSDMDDLIAHPQVRIATVDTPSGPVELLGSGAREQGGAPPRLGPVPACGEHSESLRREFSVRA